MYSLYLLIINTMVSAEHYGNNCDELVEYITNNYKTFPEIKDKIYVKSENIKKMNFMFEIVLYLYVAACIIGLLIVIHHDDFNFILLIVTISYATLLSVLLLIKMLYQTNHFGIFPVYVEEIEIFSGKFAGTIFFVSDNKSYVKLEGILETSNMSYYLNINNVNHSFDNFEINDINNLC